MTSDNKGNLYAYRLRKEDIATYVAIGEGDAMILNVYKNAQRRPRVAVLHAMVGQSAKCWEEKHEVVIQSLNERVRVQAKIILAYLHKYGPITEKTPMEQGKPEAAPEKPEAGQE